MSLKVAMTVCALVCWNVGGLTQAGEASDTLTDSVQMAPLSDSDLGDQRARGIGDTLNIGEVNVQFSNVGQNASLDHNSVNSSTTGNNTVSNNAFAGSTGFATVIQNSGNNVIIQNSTIVNFAMHQ